MSDLKRLVLGTRGSKLALAQSGQVADALSAATGLPVELKVISTKGDRVQDRPLPEVGGKGLFTLELEEELRARTIDLAVHSLKDLPTDDSDGLIVACYPERVDPRDVLVGLPLEALPQGAIVGTGSARRATQLRDLRPDLEIRGIRGNVDTRIRKLHEQDYQAIVLAAAGLARLGLDIEHFPLDPEQCLPAPGQGVLGIQCAGDRSDIIELLQRLDHAPTRARITAERSFLAALGGGCSVPAGCFAEVEGPDLRVRAALADESGKVHRRETRGRIEQAAALGAVLAAVLRQEA
ncbi:MAG: hydroxymethylbilane synthase [Cognaticolwellia sp.]|jgi:hydroxymethylbilane synthase